MVQLNQAINAAFDLFIKSDVPSPRLNAELLMMFTLGCDRAYLFAHPERPLAEEEYSRYQEVIKERARGCPTQYITGHQEFWGLDLIVSPAVLIPRPETEHIIETVLELAQFHFPDGKVTIVDVGTGSGCIALALAAELPQAEIHACDISEEALEIARINAARLGLAERVQFRRSDLLAAYPDAQFDFVVSNPPYVGESEADKVQKQVREFEPKIAVFSGWQGMDIYRRLIPQACAALKPGGWFVTEIGFSIEQQVKECLTEWPEIQTKTDLQGIPRVIAARRPINSEELVQL
jgi:release factor glutamine methyltransferase